MIYLNLQSNRLLLNFALLNLLCSLLFFLITPSHADDSIQTFQSPKKLNEIVLEHLKQKVDQKLNSPVISINPISKRLRLARCETPIQLQDKSPEKITGRVTIRLSCSKPAWKLFVTANIDGKLPVIVSTNGILKQTVIQKTDIKRIYLPYKKVRRGSMQSLEKVIGMRAKKSIGPNKVISINFLQPPYLVFKNQPINIVSHIGKLKVEMAGVALQSGTKQQQISFKNNSSNRVLKGIVIAPNTVWVP